MHWQEREERVEAEGGGYFRAGYGTYGSLRKMNMTNWVRFDF